MSTQALTAPFQANRVTVAALAAIGVFAAVLVAPSMVSAQGSTPALAGPAAGIFDGIQQTYQLAARSWRPRLIPLAQRTFVLLASIEFVVSALWWAFFSRQLDELAAKFVAKFALLAFLLTLITSFDFWFPPIVNGFVFAGEQAIGSSGIVSPSAIVDIGRETALNVLGAVSLSVVARDPVMAIFAALSAILIALAYIIVAAELMLVMIQSYVVVMGGGILFLGFAGSRWTAGFAENIVAYAFYVGTKAFLLYLIVAAGAAVARSLIPLIQTSTFWGPSTPLFHVLGAAIVLAIVAIRIPRSVAGRLVHNQTFGIAQALRALS